MISVPLQRFLGIIAGCISCSCSKVESYLLWC